MPQPPPVDSHSGRRRSPRFAFDALVRLGFRPRDNRQPVWCRSTDICHDGIGMDVLAGELNPDELVLLQIPLPKQAPADLEACVRYRNGLHCGFAFVGLNEGQRDAIRTACEALARSRTA